MSGVAVVVGAPTVSGVARVVGVWGGCLACVYLVVESGGVKQCAAQAFRTNGHWFVVVVTKSGKHFWDVCIKDAKLISLKTGGTRPRGAREDGGEGGGWWARGGGGGQL